MLDEIRIEEILFLDIETVPQFRFFDEMPENLKYLWDRKSRHFRPENQTALEAYPRAGIYAEFGKIICISVGFIKKQNGIHFLRIKSFSSLNEKELLYDFCKMISATFHKKGFSYLCAHNGKEFDYPYIARRCLINAIKLPKILDIAGKKPWEVKHLDTMELWKFGDYKQYTSLELLTTIFNIPTSKDDINGSDVARVYWEENNLERIVRYCEKDVVAIAQLIMRYKGAELITNENINFIETSKTEKNDLYDH
jgi:DNA polymerase elongation subunit (family B)